MAAPKEAKKRAVELRKLLAHHAHQYYTLDQPEISDSAYDTLYRELKATEEQYPELIEKSSVTQRIIGDVVPSLKKVRHEVPQWSFNDAFTEDEIRAFDARVRKITGKCPRMTSNLKSTG